jgi:hypothetical protein
MEVSGHLHTPIALPPGKQPSVPIGRKLDGPQSRSGRGEKVLTVLTECLMSSCLSLLLLLVPSCDKTARCFLSLALPYNLYTVLIFSAYIFNIMHSYYLLRNEY